MREHYDLEKMKGQKLPYFKQLKLQVRMRMDKSTIA